MRLSEAIRLGATIRPQAMGFYFVADASCAIGAACEAVGIGEFIDTPSLVNAFGKYWFEVGQRLPCPECGKVFDKDKSRARTITHLNDDHMWTRERIADFVELHELPQSEPISDVDRISYIGIVS